MRDSVYTSLRLICEIIILNVFIMVYLFIYLFIYIAREKQIDLQMFERMQVEFKCLERIHVLHSSCEIHR